MPSLSTAAIAPSGGEHFPESADWAAPLVLAIANQKGGVGKTTTAVNLATALAAIGDRVLLVDLDPQGNATTSLGFSRKMLKRTTYEMLLGQAALADIVLESGVPNLELLPATFDLAGAEIELAELERPEIRLRQALEPYAPLPWQVVLIDCPPSLGRLTLNALVAAQKVLVPVQCEFLALEGLGHLLRTLKRIRSRLNPALKLQGIVLTMFDARSNLCSRVAADVRETLGRNVLNTVIPRNIRVSEAPSHGRPLLLYDHRCKGAAAYLDLAREFLTYRLPSRAILHEA